MIKKSILRKWRDFRIEIIKEAREVDYDFSDVEFEVKDLIKRISRNLADIKGQIKRGQKPARSNIKFIRNFAERIADHADDLEKL